MTVRFVFLRKGAASAAGASLPQSRLRRDSSLIRGSRETDKALRFS
ncbi:hypothetical protein [Providencia stuartii]|uniref:Uncharacterized protein n=1 Tax=Klebsiella pneumoniae TaxID=573 RepID=A0A1J0QZZ9_KLEPN|nr:hypothetical protein [Providencia stuartii]APD70477.1 hypothetical protein [Klebsiella pneumoniae]APD70842.1 hypothetical protein [Klebsiella pneumoniae]NMT48936.1 hypothetical protein [Providencia stuartii]